MAETLRAEVAVAVLLPGRFLARLEVAGFGLERSAQVITIRPQPGMPPALAQARSENGTLTVLFVEPAPLTATAARRSTKVAEFRNAAALVLAARRIRKMPERERAAAVFSQLMAARRSILGSDGIRAATLRSARGPAVRGGLPGLGRRR